MMKLCNSCKVNKDKSEFTLRSSAKDGLRSSCRECEAKCKAQYRENNKDKISAYSRKYYQENIESQLEKNRIRRKNNPEAVKAYNKKYRETTTKKYKKCKDQQRKRRAEDPMFRARQNLSCLIRNSLQGRGYRKTSKSAKLLGASFDVVYQHLVDSAIRNYGYYDPDFTYHIDHIIPCSVATSQEESETLQFYYNLQYLTPEDNLRKSNKFKGTL